MAVVPGLTALMQAPSLASSSHSPSSLFDSSAPTASPPFCSFTSMLGGVSLPPCSASQRWSPAAAPPPLRDGAYR